MCLSNLGAPDLNPVSTDKVTDEKKSFQLRLVHLKVIREGLFKLFSIAN